MLSSHKATVFFVSTPHTHTCVKIKQNLKCHLRHTITSTRAVIEPNPTFQWPLCFFQIIRKPSPPPKFGRGVSIAWVLCCAIKHDPRGGARDQCQNPVPVLIQLRVEETENNHEKKNPLMVAQWMLSYGISFQLVFINCRI